MSSVCDGYTGALAEYYGTLLRACDRRTVDLDNKTKDLVQWEQAVVKLESMYTPSSVSRAMSLEESCAPSSEVTHLREELQKQKNQSSVLLKERNDLQKNLKQQDQKTECEACKAHVVQLTMANNRYSSCLQNLEESQTQAVQQTGTNQTKYGNSELQEKVAKLQNSNQEMRINLKELTEEKKQMENALEEAHITLTANTASAHRECETTQGVHTEAMYGLQAKYDALLLAMTDEKKLTGQLSEELKAMDEKEELLRRKIITCEENVRMLEIQAQQKAEEAVPFQAELVNLDAKLNTKDTLLKGTLCKNKELHGELQKK